MDSRMNKYHDGEDLENTRVLKHEDLYKEINKSELNNFEVKSNTTIIGNNTASIDVEKIKKILDTKYNEVPKRQSIRMEEKEEEKDELEDTKEYDINVILAKAKEQKPENYQEERLKKLHDTNFDILKNLKVEPEEPKKGKEDEDFESENLKSLINTIALNEKEAKSNPSLDILSDLKGDDDTEVLEGLKEKTTVLENSYREENPTKTELTDSFYTSSNSISNKDLEEDDDFSKDMESNNTFLKVVIALIVIIFIVGIILLIKTIYSS